MKGQQAFGEVTHALCASTTPTVLGIQEPTFVHGRDHQVHRDLTTMVAPNVSSRGTLAIVSRI